MNVPFVQNESEHQMNSVLAPRHWVFYLNKNVGVIFQPSGFDEIKL